MRRLVVVGGDAAGMAAASQVRRRAGHGGREPVEVVVLERGSFTSYSACGIPYWVAGEVDGPDALVSRTPEQHRANGIDVRMQTEAVSMDVERRSVRTRAADGTETDLGYDDLLLATGSVPTRPDVPGVRAPGVHGVQTLDDGQALLDALLAADRPVRRVAIVGGGYVGLEVAEACRRRDLEVSVVDRSPAPLASTFDPDVAEQVADAVRGLGIDLHLGSPVTGVELDADGHAAGVRTADLLVPADLVVLGLGVRPAVSLGAAAGVPLGSSGGYAVDRSMRTPVPGVWAAGDCVESVHRLSGQRAVVALGTHANKQGRVAGINLSGGYATFPGVVGTAVTRICSLEVARTGLSEREAREAGFAWVTATVDTTTRAGYFPGTAPIRVKVLAERRTGLLLGAQIVGREGAAKRIDVLAVAIWNRMTVDEVQSLDLSYAPPFAPVWDPVLVAARRAFAAVEADAPD